MIKISSMKPETLIQEILLFTTTSFSQRQLCETNLKDDNNNLSATEQLEAACWNGLLPEILPEILHAADFHERLFMWQVDMRKTYLRISIAERPPVFKMRFALDPHIFLSKMEWN